ncbi:MAG: hypothetical protein HQL56_18150 [Magnetococcales bacterium]|nr:hypothetical protein [Magnetococcales bacterium]
MPLPAWTRARTNWHDPRLGWVSLPPGVRCHRVWLEELSPRERTIFGNIIKRSPGHVLVRLAGGVRALNRTLLLEAKDMTDATDLERAAMAAALIPLGEYVGSIGMHRPLADYSKAEVLTLIDVVVSAFQNHIANANPDDIPF